MRVIPAVVQHLPRSRVERRPPKVQQGSGHPRRAVAPEGALHVNETGAGYGLRCRAVWGMLYADDACIVLRSPRGLARMMEVIVDVCRASALTVSAKKTEIMCIPPPRTPRTMVRVTAVVQVYKQVQPFTYLGGAVTETPDMSIEIARRTRACWMRIR